MIHRACGLRTEVTFEVIEITFSPLISLQGDQGVVGIRSLACHLNLISINVTTRQKP